MAGSEARLQDAIIALLREPFSPGKLEMTGSNEARGRGDVVVPRLLCKGCPGDTLIGEVLGEVA